MQGHLSQHNHDAAPAFAGQPLPNRRRQIAHREIQANAPTRTALGTRFSVIRRAPSNYERQCQWDIERLFRLMKSDGLRLEDSQLETADALMKLTAIAAKAACVILQLVQARDGSAEPASIAFSKPEIAVLDQLNGEIEGKTALQKNPHARHSLAWASWIIARMGGWNGYPSSRPPGPITMRNGWEYFCAIARGWTLRDARLL
jgi:hypothetical protein